MKDCWRKLLIWILLISNSFLKSSKVETRLLSRDSLASMSRPTSGSKEGDISPCLLFNKICASLNCALFLGKFSSELSMFYNSSSFSCSIFFSLYKTSVRYIYSINARSWY